METLEELLTDQLKDIYSAEQQLVKALPRIAKKASSPTLKDAITRHLKETENHVKRLDNVAKEMEIKLTGKKCHAMEGLIAEAKEVLDEKGQGPLIDAALIGAAQRVEHYEIAAYGTVRAMAEAMGESKVVKLLQDTLDEEGETDKKLTQIAEQEVLSEAMESQEEEEGEEEEEDEE